MSTFRSARALAAGSGLAVAVNAAMLGLAAWNRSGEPSARVEVTERELALPEFRERESSGVSLRLVCSTTAPAAVRRASALRDTRLPEVELPWLGPAKLAELGFAEDDDATRAETGEPGARSRERRALLVLEYDGEAWRRWLAGREGEVARLRGVAAAGTPEAATLADAEALLELDRTMRSRLFPVDAGLDPAALRSRYPDRHRHVIVPAVLRRPSASAAPGRPSAPLVVDQLLAADVRVPAPDAERLAGLIRHDGWRDYLDRTAAEARQGWPRPTAPRYRATLALGRRLEPWLAGLEHE